MQQVAQWYTLDVASNAPDAMKPWLIARAARIASLTLRPDRYQVFEDVEAAAEQAAVDAYLQIAWATGSGMVTSGVAPTLANLRRYVASYCARAMTETPAVGGSRSRPRLWLNPELTDVAACTVFNRAWNHADWQFKRRQATLSIARATFTGGTWVNATRVLTAAGAFAGVAAGAVVRITGGTDTVTGDYMVTAASTDTITLASSLQTTGGTAAAIAGVVATASVLGVPTGEAYDSDQTTQWLYTSDGARLEWALPDVQAFVRVHYSDAGRPMCYRVYERLGVRYWTFHPFPDADYTLAGEVAVSGPGTPSSATDAAVYQKFPAEFYPYFFHATLAQVLTGLGHARGAALAAEARSDLERLLTTYADSGASSTGRALRDVYGDAAALSHWHWPYQHVLGGPI